MRTAGARAKFCSLSMLSSSTMIDFRAGVLLIEREHASVLLTRARTQLDAAPEVVANGTVPPAPAEKAAACPMATMAKTANLSIFEITLFGCINSRENLTKVQKRRGKRKKLPKKNEVSGFLNTAQHLCAILM